MPVSDLQVWANVVEDVRLPTLETKTSSLDALINTKVQEFGDTFTTYLTMIQAAQSSADSAVATANNSLPRIYQGDLDTKVYVDLKIQALRDELTGSLNSLQGYLDGDFLTGIGGTIADQITAITVAVNASVATVNALHDEISADIVELRAVSSDILDDILPGTQAQLSATVMSLGSVAAQLDQMLAGFTYDNLLAGIEAVQGQIADTISPIGVFIPKAPASAWTADGPSGASSTVKTPIPSSWFTRDVLLGDAVILPLGVNQPIGQAYPVDFSPTRVYRVRARFRVSNNGTNGVAAYIGVSTWNGNTALQLNVLKTLRSSYYTAADGIVEVTAIFSADLTRLEENHYVIGTGADNTATHLSGSASANKAFFFFRQNGDGITNGQTILGLFEVKDITDALDAAKIVRTELTAKYNDAIAAVDSLSAAITGPNGSIAVLRDELNTSIDGVNSNLTNNYYTAATTDTAISNAVNAMKASIVDPAGSSLGATLSNEYYTRVATDSAISAAVMNLSSTLVVNQTVRANGGVILYQSTTPGTTYRNALNIWVDTTSVPYKPKRWNGSAWAIVTDSDAVTAANASLAAIAFMSNITTNYYTRTQADQAVAGAISTFNASIPGGLTATVSNHSTAIADLDDGLRAQVGFRAQAGNQVSLLDLIAYDGSETGNRSYSIARISASQILLDGSVTANQIAAGTIKTTNLAIGMDCNYVFDSSFLQGTGPWVMGKSGNAGASSTLSMRARGQGWAGQSFETLMIFQSDDAADGYATIYNQATLPDGTKTNLVTPCSAGDFIEVSAQVSTHRCLGHILIRWFDSTGTAISNVIVDSRDNILGSSSNPDSWGKIGGRVQAPANAAYCQIAFRKQATSSGSNSYMFIHKPMLTIVSGIPATWEFAPYVVGHGTTLSGDALIIRTVRGDHLVAKTITAASGVIDDLAVDTLQIAGNAVTIPVNSYVGAEVVIGNTSASAVEIGRVVINRVANYSTKVSFSCNTRYTPDDNDDPLITPVIFNLYRNGTLIFTTSVLGYRNTGVTSSFTFVDTNTAGGSTTYTVEAYVNTGEMYIFPWYGTRDSYASKRNLEAIVFKR